MNSNQTTEKTQRHTQFRRLFWLAAFLLVGGSAYGLLRLLIPAAFFDRAAGYRVVEAICSRKLRPDSHGAVSLPSDMAGLSCNGRVFVTQKKEGPLLVYFPLAEFIDAEGMLYSSPTLTDKDALKGEYEDPERTRYEILIREEAMVFVEVVYAYGDGWYFTRFRMN